MKTIYEVKDFVYGAFNKDVLIKVMGIRNKVEEVEGKIVQCYRHLFVVDTQKGKRSFSYVDVLIGNIKVKVK